MNLNYGRSRRVSLFTLIFLLKRCSLFSPWTWRPLKMFLLFVITCRKIHILFNSSRLSTQEVLLRLLGSLLSSDPCTPATSPLQVRFLLCCASSILLYFFIIWLQRAASCHSLHTSSLDFLFCCIMALLCSESLLSQEWSFTKTGIEWRWSSNYLGAKENPAFEKDPESNE